MTTDYIHRATKFCPVDLYPLYQELEGAWGESMGDHLVPRSATHQDALGSLYIVTSGVCTDRLLQRADVGIVERPGYDSGLLIDLVKAQFAADLVVIYSGTETASPDIILAVINVPAVEAIGLMGLTAIL